MKHIVNIGLCIVLLLASFDESFASRKRISSLISLASYSEADIEKEVTFGREVAASILADFKLSENTSLNKYVNLVGSVLLQHSTRQEIPFHFSIIDSTSINAYAAPGGYIFITQAAIDQMQNEAELAGVLAHEIAHITQRHIVKALKIKAEDDSVTASFSKIVGSGGSSANIIFDQVVGKAMEILFSSGLKIEDEFNADEMGIILSSVAGYNPAAYYNFLERIKPLIDVKGGEINKTHPPLNIRLKKLQKIIDDEGLGELAGYINATRFNKNSSFKESN